MTAPDDILVWQILAIAWLLGWSIRSLLAISRGDRRTIMFVQLVHFLFFGVPIILDVFVAPPEYPFQWGFIVSGEDRQTNLLYLGYMCLVPVVFALFGGRARAQRERTRHEIRLRAWQRAVAWTPLIALPLAIAFAPNPAVYLKYAAMIGAQTNEPAQLYHGVVALIANFAVISSALLLFARDSSYLERWLMPIAIGMTIWVHGKRSIVALAIMLILYLLWWQGRLRGPRLLAALFAAVTTFAAYSYLYQTDIRDIDQEIAPARSISQSHVYVNFRIDYGRDATTKQTIFAELHPETMKILEYRGQSILFYLTFVVPRSMWPGKPYPYSVYVTSAMLRSPPRYINWGMTTSWLEEAIANFGWFGLLLGPLLPTMVCRAGDRYRTPFRSLLTVSVASLFMVLHLVAFMSVFLVWLVVITRAAIASPPPRMGDE